MLFAEHTLRSVKLTLVRRAILEQDHLSLFEVKTSLLCQEQIGPFDNVLEMRLALVIDERRDIGDIDGFGSELFVQLELLALRDDVVLTDHRRERTCRP